MESNCYKAMNILFELDNIEIDRIYVLEGMQFFIVVLGGKT